MTHYGNFKSNRVKNSSFYFQTPLSIEEMNLTQQNLIKSGPKIAAKRDSGSSRSRSFSQERSIESIKKQMSANSKDVSFGGVAGKKDVAIGVVRILPNILGPTEYMSLTSESQTPEETNGPSKKVRILIQ